MFSNCKHIQQLLNNICVGIILRFFFFFFAYDAALSCESYMGFLIHYFERSFSLTRYNSSSISMQILRFTTVSTHVPNMYLYHVRNVMRISLCTCCSILLWKKKPKQNKIRPVRHNCCMHNSARLRHRQ